MATFAELRERFSDDEYKRGKQFERVCKWFLETDPRYSDRLVNVWLWDDWPGRWGPDCGIDLGDRRSRVQISAARPIKPQVRAGSFGAGPPDFVLVLHALLHTRPNQPVRSWTYWFVAALEIRILS